MSPTTVLLLSGGLDSSALAAWCKPEVSVFVDYGQRPAAAEGRAARAVAKELGMQHHELVVGLGNLGAGLLSAAEVPTHWPSPEWWPFRNQLLVTCVAAWAMRENIGSTTAGTGVRLLTGTLSSDGARHLDGTSAFYEALTALLQTQEGQFTVEAPALRYTATELIQRSEVPDRVLAWTHSCHVANVPCSLCPGCLKRDEALHQLGRLQ